MKKKPKRILIAGYFGYGNTGDEAILSAMIGDLSSGEPEVEINVVSDNPEDTSIHHQVGAVGIGDLQRIIEAISMSDLVIIGGGGLFHDYWDFQPGKILTSQHAGMPFYGSIALLARILEKPLMLYGIGIGPLQSAEGQLLTRAIADLADIVSVRDSGSKEILEHLGGNIENVLVTADPAFRLQVNEIPCVITDEVMHKGPILGVVLRYWDFDASPEIYEECVGKAINNFLDLYDGIAVFLPFQEQEDKFLDDRAVSERVKSYLRNPERAYILSGDYSPAEMAGLVAECDLVLSMRMHATIFAINNGIPVVSLVYDPKIRYLMEQSGIEDYAIHLSKADEKTLGALLDRALKNSSKLKNKLNSTGDLFRDKALENVGLAITLLEQGSKRRKPLSPEAEQLLNQTSLSLSTLLQENSEQYQELEESSHAQIKSLNDIVDELKNNLDNQKVKHNEQLLGLEQKINKWNKRIEEANNKLELKDAVIHNLNKQLDEIKRSRGWKFLWWLWEVRAFLIPKGSSREILIKRLKKIFGNNPQQLYKKATNWFQGQFSIWMSREAYAFDIYKRPRSINYETNFQSLRFPSQKGMVSIVLPVYNGSDFVAQALESVLNQTYRNFELIAVNDGSQDHTGEILDEYAKRDERIRVYHQENKKLPAALSQGFRLAGGEYLTWISHDNRLKSNFLEKMVSCLERHPSWDMVYANQDLIGEDGYPLKGSDYYSGYQRPPGSEHIHLPNDTAVLNTCANNFIGGAFLYRDRVSWLIGDYSPLRYTREDYDYWMRINALLTLRHVDFKDPVYEYRFHSDSLTNQDEKLGITRDRGNLMVFDDFRREFYLTPLVWYIDDDSTVDGSPEVISHLKSSIDNAGHLIGELGQYKLPELFVHSVYLRITTNPELTPPVPGGLQISTTKVLLYLHPKKNLPQSIREEWDICLALGSELEPIRMHNEQPWVVSDEIAALFTAIDIKARSQHLERIEQEIALDKKQKLKASVIICTYNRQENIKGALQSASLQTMSKDDYEIIVVNNDPDRNQVDGEVERIRERYFSNNPNHIRIIDCPVSGLSSARNAGISEASGKILYFLDDDASAAKDNLELYWKAFEEYSNVGVIGGQIILDLPETMPMIWKEEWGPYWSQLTTDYSEYREVENWWEYPWGANWCARREALLLIGGFRTAFGRRGNDFSGGEEIIAAILVNRLGYSIAILPEAKVAHHIDVNRFSLEHLRNTIRAGLFTEYKAQVQLYLPTNRMIMKALGQFNKALLKNMSRFRRAGPLKKADRIEAYYYSTARARLIWYRIADTIKRLRNPITKKKRAVNEIRY